jgi:hypothetical protein
MNMERILLIVGRVENSLSVRNSRFRHQTLLAITVGSRQVVAYTCIRTCEDHVWFEDQWMVASLCDE